MLLEIIYSQHAVKDERFESHLVPLSALIVTLYWVLSHDAKKRKGQVRPSVFSCILGVLFAIKLLTNM